MKFSPGYRATAADLLDTAQGAVGNRSFPWNRLGKNFTASLCSRPKRRRLTNALTQRNWQCTNGSGCCPRTPPEHQKKDKLLTMLCGVFPFCGRVVALRHS